MLRVAVGETAGEGPGGKPESSRVRQSEGKPETDVISQYRGERGVKTEPLSCRRQPTEDQTVYRTLSGHTKDTVRTQGGHTEDTLKTVWGHTEVRVKPQGSD